jgi:uncharacterized membrane protein YgcG
MSLKKNLSSLLAATMIASAPLPALVFASAAQAQEPPAATETAAAPAAEASTATPAPAPAADISKEVVDNPYGLDALWKQGDFVAKGTLVILLIMSFGSWYILAIKLYEQFKLRQQAKHMQETFWSAGSIEKGIEGLSKDGPFHYVAQTGVTAVGQYQGARPDTIDLNSWTVQSRMQDGLAFPRHGRFDGAVRRPVRHRLGHLPRADGDRHRRPGFDRQGGRPGRRGADHDGHRPGGGSAGGAGLQLAGAAQQGGDGRCARLRADLHAQC